MDAILFDVDGLVRVAAENAVGAVMTGVGKGSRCNFCRHAQPARVQPVDQTGNRLALEIELLQEEIKRSADPAERHPVDLEAVELVAVDRDVGQPAVLPGVALIDAHAHQVRHDIGEAVVVVAFHPDHFHLAFGIR